MNLFQKKNVTLNSGIESSFKIECDALTKEDLECISFLISEKIKFRKVIGIPTGGVVLENHLKKYETGDVQDPILICDDVSTTGGSMERKKKELIDSGYVDGDIIGIVIFDRGNLSGWMQSVFKMNL